ncbi:deoxyuridine 5'-triphosphate nucleotidohydrolase [Trichomonascus vanleenenianus]|uniref:bifunctional dITP/dUTP diphosphatase n=1 Tax=Trichomonascus vanleenenianus TaxID=2268995 RepID=UPI003ECAB067
MTVAALEIKFLSPDAKAPTRGSAFAAGYDMYSSSSVEIPAHGRALVPTGISMAIPEGTYGRVAPRSGLAVKHGIQTGAGVIDSDYRGEVRVLLFNHSDDAYRIEKGDRIAQLILEQIVNPEVQVVETLSETVRGAGGFGSTGYN